MRPTLQLAIATLFFCLTGCDPAENIRIRIDNTDAPNVKVTSAVILIPGANNPIEAVIDLQNTGDTRLALAVDVTWSRDGAFSGSQSSSLTLGPGGRFQFVSGTTAARVTEFRARIQPANSASVTSVPGNLEVARGYGMTWSPDPASEQIPDLPVRGEVLGRPFSAGTVMFYPGPSGWRLEISDELIDPTLSAGTARYEYKNLQTASISLDSEPAPGKRFDKPMSWGGGIFQIRHPDGSPGTTTWNTNLAWKIEFSEWSRQPFDPSGDTAQIAGQASGRLFIAFEGGELPNAWLSGAFRDVPVVYFGDPASITPQD